MSTDLSLNPETHCPAASAPGRLAGAARPAGRILLALGVFLGLAVGVSAAQDPPRGSRNLPVDHWAYEYIQRLRTRGLLASLNPLVRPHRRGDIAIALAALDPDTLSNPVAGWVRLLHAEFWRELDRIARREVVAWGVSATGTLVASTGQRLDVLRPIGDADAWPRTSVGAWVERGPFAAEARLTYEGQLEDDPDGPVDQGRMGRTDNGYLSLGVSWADVWFGRVKQNWSALGTQGLMVSDGAPAYNQIAYEVRVGPFALRSLTGELETLPPTGAFGLKRYLSAHRFEYRSDHVALAVGEATLFASDKGFQLRFLNPLEGTLLQTTTRAPGAGIENVENSMVEALAWFGGGGVEGYVEFLVDDIDANPGPLGAEPFTYAFTLGTRFATIAPWLELGLEYAQVSAFAYRAPLVDLDRDGVVESMVDSWTFVGRGLGDNFSDFDRFTLTADLFTGLRGLRLTPLLQIQRQGEGSFRDPVPPRDIHVASPALFLGVKETTVRLGLRGRFQPNRFVHVSWDVGENFIQDAQHVRGRDVSDFTAVLEAGFMLELPLRR